MPEEDCLWQGLIGVLVKKGKIIIIKKKGLRVPGHILEMVMVHGLDAVGSSHVQAYDKYKDCSDFNSKI